MTKWTALTAMHAVDILESVGLACEAFMRTFAVKRTGLIATVAKKAITVSRESCLDKVEIPGTTAQLECGAF